MTRRGDLQITPRGKVVQGGVGYRFSGAWQLVGEVRVHHYSDTEGRPALAHLIAQYDLSKRTMLYGFWAKVDNRGGARMGTAFATSAALAGQEQSAVGLGVYHRF